VRILRKKVLRKQSVSPEVYVSGKLKLDITRLESSFYRADLIIHGLDHSGPSYEGRVFINSPNADHKTPDDPAQGYTGSFFVFGHGGCLGDEGHCDINRPSVRFNMIPNTLIPEKVSLIVTEKIKQLGKTTDEFTITIVPKLAGGSESACQNDADLKNVVLLHKISIETYDKDE
jgi:hypothetical protein